MNNTIKSRNIKLLNKLVKGLRQEINQKIKDELTLQMFETLINEVETDGSVSIQEKIANRIPAIRDLANRCSNKEIA